VNQSFWWFISLELVLGLVFLLPHRGIFATRQMYIKQESPGKPRRLI